MNIDPVDKMCTGGKTEKYILRKTFEGLITSYTLALPFFKNTLISTCLFTGLLTISIKYLGAVNETTNYFIFNFINKIRNISR